MPDSPVSLSGDCRTCGGKGYRRTNDGHGRQVEERCPTCLGRCSCARRAEHAPAAAYLERDCYDNGCKDMRPSVSLIRRRTEAEVEAYVQGYRAAIDTVLRTAGLELSAATAEKIKAFAEIVGTGV